MKKKLILMLTGLIIAGAIAVEMNFRMLQKNTFHHVNPQTQPICVIDTSEAYLVFWEKIFLTRDQVWSEYQNNHIATITIVQVI